MENLTGRRVAVIYLVYFALHLAFHAVARFFEVAPGISIWYPPVGLALALATITGARCAPIVLAAHLLSALVISTHPATWTSWALPLQITAMYVGSGALVRRWLGPMPKPVSPLQTTGLIGVYLAAPTLAASVGAALTVLAGHASPGQYLSIAGRWWIGDLTGVLTVVPVCLVHVAPWVLQRQRPRRPWTPSQRWEVVAQASAIAAFLVLVHGLAYLHPHQTYYLCFVPLVWICLRHGLAGATIAVLTLTIGTLLSLHLSHAPAVVVTDLLLFEIGVATIGLGLGATVTRRARAESERSRLLAILEASPDFIATADLDGRILYQNTALRLLHGDPATGPLPIRQVSQSHSRAAAGRIQQEALPTALAQGSWQGETVLQHHDGREIPVLQLILTHRDAAGRPMMLSTVARDISSQKQAERARLESERSLLQAQKLESLGVLAGGIAHDFNNLLTVVLGNATLARTDLPADSAVDHAVHQIEKAALRAADLCQQMLAYSGRSKLSVELLDLNTIVEETTHLLGVSVSKKCKLEIELARDLPPVEGDASQLSQIAMNLVINASEASEEQGGHITVRTGQMQADAGYLAGASHSRTTVAGKYVFLEVSDQGRGMPEAVQRRIFEPFFTTKFSGHGLGLSAVLGIVQGHRGAIKVTSAPGRGTTFRVLLPAAQGVARPRCEQLDPADTWRGSGRVLVVDDEESVREITSKILRHYGFEPTVAIHGREAVDLFRRQPGHFCVVLLDLSMPVMDGREALREISQLDPRVPVLLMSGYDKTDSTELLTTDQVAGFLQKPFQAACLAAALREALNARMTRAA